MTNILIAIFSALVVAAFAYLAVRRATRDRGAVSDSEARLSASLLEIRDSVGRWREEARTTVQEKIGELYEKVEQQNRAARGETQQTLEQLRRESRETLEQATRALTERFEKLQESNEKKLAEIRGEVEQKLEQTRQNMGQTFKDVTERLSELHVTNQRIVDFSKDLQVLQAILQAPRLRGEMGQTEMEQMLRQCLAPEQFAFQYPIEGGFVDAVIFNPTGNLPIDSKFPLDQWRLSNDPDIAEADRKSARRNFAGKVKKHMDSIAEKYIRPPQTLEFAIMFIPVESVYYEFLENAELIEYAHRCRVVPASPLTFWALLQVIVMGFRGMQISEDARRISGLLVALRDDMKKFRDTFETAAKQVENANRNMTSAAKHLDHVDGKLENIRSVRSPNDEQNPPSLPAGEPA